MRYIYVSLGVAAVALLLLQHPGSRPGNCYNDMIPLAPDERCHCYTRCPDKQEDPKCARFCAKDKCKCKPKDCDKPS